MNTDFDAYNAMAAVNEESYVYIPLGSEQQRLDQMQRLAMRAVFLAFCTGVLVGAGLAVLTVLAL